MKVAAIFVTALAVSTGALGQARDGESLGQKAGRVFDRMENATKRGVDKVRGTGEKAGNAVENKEAKREVKQGDKQAKRDAKRDDTHAMGAGKTGKADKMRDRSDQRADSGNRQSRMDDAYGNWKNQQKR